jgi:membrane-anchored protein YejM (alkaline phosphatase superfamily)
VSAPAEHKNLLVVVVDSLRADMLNNINMPNLQRYADQHLNFANHMSGGNDDAMGMFSLFYGLPGHYYGDIRADKRPPVLFDEMLRQDYQFGLFGALEDAQQYQQSLLAGLRKQVFVSRQTDDTRLIGDWQQWLGTRTMDRPWFSLVYLSSPGDYQVPASLKGPFQPELTRFNPATAYRPENLQKLENRYKNSVFYTDQLLEQMLSQLQQQGLGEQTIVVITSNHGQEFNETQSNSWGYGSNYSPYQVQVPLVLAWPGIDSQPQEQASSHLDLVPTLMKGMLGVRNPPRDYSTGRSLFDTSPRNWLLAGDQNDFAIYQDNTITQFNKQGDFELLDRATYRPIKHGTPDMGAMIQVMNELNRFYRTP